MGIFRILLRFICGVFAIILTIVGLAALVGGAPTPLGTYVSILLLIIVFGQYAYAGHLFTRRKSKVKGRTETTRQQAGAGSNRSWSDVRDSSSSAGIRTNTADEALRQGIEAGDVQAIQAALAAGADPNKILLGFGTKDSVLNRALPKPEVILELTRAGAILPEIDLFGRNPLHYAYELANELDDDDECYKAINGFIRNLVKAGANPNLRDNNGDTPLLHTYREGYAFSAREIRAWKKAGADINARSKNDETVLHLAIKSGFDGEIISGLISAGADINARNHAGETAIMIAGDHPDEDVIAALLKAMPEILDRKGHTALHMAAMMGDRDLAAKLLLHNNDCKDAQTSSGQSALHFATLKNKPDVVVTLLEAGANPNLPDQDGNTPLHIASYEGLTAIAHALLAAGADVTMKNSSGNTALDEAINDPAMEATLGRNA